MISLIGSIQRKDAAYVSVMEPLDRHDNLTSSDLAGLMVE
jgi:hypothetical protein